MLNSIFNGNGLFLFLAFIAFIQLIIWLSPIPQSRSRKSVRDQEERKVFANLTPEALGLVKDAIRSNRKIEAIKILRAETNAGLRTAVHCVEKLSADIEKNI